MGSGARRLLGVAIALGAVGAACSDDASRAFSTPNATIIDGLTVLPLAEDDASSDITITINHFAAAAAAMGAEPPPDGAGVADARDWVDQLFGGRLDLRPPTLLGTDPLEEPEVVRDEFGWSPYDVEVAAEITRFGDDDAASVFTVLHGDISWVDGSDLGSGVGSIGSGDDNSRNDEQRSQLRPFGTPIRTGVRDGLVAAGSSTDQMREWVSGGTENAASDPALRSAAARLDAVDAYTARLVERDFAQRAEGSPSAAIDEPFDVLAVGLSGEFAELTSTIVYVFADEDAAKSAVGQIDDAWHSLDLSELDGTYEIGTLEHRGDAVVVIGRVEDGRTANDLVRVAEAAGLFTHS